MCDCACAPAVGGCLDCTERARSEHAGRIDIVAELDKDAANGASRYHAKALISGQQETQETHGQDQDQDPSSNPVTSEKMPRCLGEGSGPSARVAESIAAWVAIRALLRE